MTYTCPVCGYPNLEDPPENNEICPSCGTQFGYHDFTRSHADLRTRWLERGAQWHSRVEAQPLDWNAYRQLYNAGFIEQTAEDETATNKPLTIRSQHFIYVWAIVHTRTITLAEPSYELLGRFNLASAEV